jgi:LPPG:FO 2-phospho-L-lactate transferase
VKLRHRPELAKTRAPATVKPVIVALAGGVGAARFLTGLLNLIDPGDLTVVVNTGDDLDYMGLRVCPDLDTITYTLAGLANSETGWGRAGDSFRVGDELARFGRPNWFKLGDLDMAMCLHRTELLNRGAPLDRVLSDTAGHLGISSRILPMTNDRVMTRLQVAGGSWLDFQEYFVRERHQVEVSQIDYHGAAQAAANPSALAALERADGVLVCPSNPILSVGPILAVPGFREILGQRQDAVAISPLVGGRAMRGPADRLMAQLGHEPSSLGVGRMFRDFCGCLIIDHADASRRQAIVDLGVKCVVTDTVMASPARTTELARTALAQLPGWR